MRVASLSRHRHPADPDLIEARRDLNARKLHEYVVRTLCEFPPLTREQLDAVGALLAGGRRDGQS